MKYLTRFVGCLACVLLTYSACAQQVVQERLFGGSGYGKSIRASLRLSPTRYVLVGSADHSSQPGTVGMLIFMNANGDSLTSVYYDHYEQSAFFACVPTSEPSPYFLVSGFHTDTATQRLCGLLVKYDTLGNVIWERRETFPNSLGGGSYGGPVRVPDGYLFNSYEQLAAPTPNNFYGTVKLLKTDFAGTIQWSRTYGTEDDGAGPPIWLPDGSLLLAGTVSYPQASGRVRVCGKLWQLNPVDGSPIRIDTLAMTSGEALSISAVSSLPNGGFLLTGAMRERLTQSGFPVVVLRALDANWQTVWEKRFPPGGRRNDTPSGPGDALPLQNGETLWVGVEPSPVSSATSRVAMGILAPPSGGTASTRWSFLGAPPAFWESTLAYEIIPTTLGNALVLGMYNPPNTQQRTFYLANLTGLPAFYTPDYCTTPPPAPVVTVGPLTGSTFSFAVDSAATAAGPAYAYIPTVTWDFGDGSAPVTGWSVRHTYASPQPVRVRACVTNSLFCTTCTDCYPLGVPAALPASALQVWPNPAAGGRFRLRLAVGGEGVGALVRVYDALGREVGRQPVAPSGGETLLDLSAQPAGVYALRLTLTDGRSAVRRLVVVVE